MAEDDLVALFLHFAADNPVAATRFTHDLTNKIEWIALSGWPSAPRDDLSSELTPAIFCQRRVFSRTTKDHVIILRILYGRQTIAAEDFPESEN